MKIAEHQSAMIFTKAIAVLMIGTFAAGIAIGGVLLMQLGDLGGGESHQPNEALELSDQHVWACAWVNEEGWAEAAISVFNTGDTDAAFRRITVRGVECSWSNVYYWKTDTGPVSDALKPTSTELSSSSVMIDVDGVERIFHQTPATGLILPHDWTLVLYIKDPINLTAYDGGERIVISIFTDNDIYFEETYLEGSRTFTFMQTEQVSITNMQFTGTSNTTTNDIVLSVKNTGSCKVTITQVTVNGVVHTATYAPAAEIQPGGTATVTVNDVNWISGNTYRVVLQSSTGTNVASYEKKAS